VITTDTCVAHLAGAMNKPVWILLPHLSDWRWMEEAVTTPWYPSAQLFRQKASGDRAGVLDRVSGVLQALTLPGTSGRAESKRALRQTLPEEASLHR
jgi:ADP-heptose:LPS heptosyltransferase